jgi:hypothetical protein
MAQSKRDKPNPGESPPETAEEAAQIIAGDPAPTGFIARLEANLLELGGAAAPENAVVPDPAQIEREIEHWVALGAGPDPSTASHASSSDATTLPTTSIDPSAQGNASGPPSSSGGPPPISNQGRPLMPASHVIVFTDMQERDDAEIQRLSNRQYDLNAQMLQMGGKLPPDLQKELDTIIAKLAASSQLNAVLDPFFTHYSDRSIGVRDTLGAIMPPLVEDHFHGVLPQNHHGAELTPHEKALAAVYGLMEADGLTDPTLARFVPGVAAALGEYTRNKPLFDRVLDIMVHEGDTGQLFEKRPSSNVRAEQWAQVSRALRNEGTLFTDQYLNLKTLTALANAVGAGTSAPPSSISIVLPDLDAESDLEIVADNIRAMQAIYFAAMLDEVKFFQVADKNVELWQSGMLPLGKGNAGDQLYAYWKKSVNRMQEVERRNLYARTFGLNGGETQVIPNRDFNDLWMRFLSAVSSFVRQFTLEDLLRSSVPVPVTQEQVRKSGMDLAANLSLHGYGIAYFAATDLQTQINDVIAILSDPEVKTAWSARDMWQVNEQVSTLYLGGAKNTVRYRTMAMSGAVIIRWLAERAHLLTGSSLTSVIDVNLIRSPLGNANSRQPMVSPTDRDLWDACNQWLAVTGTQEQSIEDHAQPIETPPQTSRPIQIPDIARDMLSSVGISAGLSSNGNYARR